MGQTKSDVEYLWKLYSSQLNETTRQQLLKPTGKRGEHKRCDYISALSKLNAYKRHGHTIDNTTTALDIWNGLTNSERYRLAFYTPCLARPIDDLNAREQSDVFNNPDWVFTEKHRGLRATLIVNNRTTNLFSRHYSDDCALIDYWNKINQHADYDGTYAVDVIMTTTNEIDITEDLARHGITAESHHEQINGLIQLEPNVSLALQKQIKDTFGTDVVVFKLIHPLYVSGVNYMKRPLGDGMNPDVYGDTVRIGQQMGLNIQPVRRSNATTEAEKRVFLKSILDDNGDGVVAQNRNGLYNTTDNRSKTSYVKIKRMTDERMADTIDGFVTRIQYDGKTLSLQMCVNEERDGGRFVRSIATIHAPKSLNPSTVYKGMVIEMTGNGLNNNGMLIKPKFVRVREDKQSYDCVYTTEFLRGQMNVK